MPVHHETLFRGMRAMLFIALVCAVGAGAYVHFTRAASYSSPFTNCFNDGDCESVGGFCRNRVCFSPENQAPPICADRCDALPYCYPGSGTCGGHTVGVNGTTVHVTDCRGIGSGRRGGVISYCDQTGRTPPPPPPTPRPPTPTPPVPTPPPGQLQDGRIVGTCTGWPNPHVEIRWSQNPPPGSQPKNSNSILRDVDGLGAQWFFGGGNPPPGVAATRIDGSYASPVGPGGYPNPNYAVYDLRDNSIQSGHTYTYKAKYRPETPSINTYSVLVNAANCGGSAGTPTPTPGVGDGRITGYCTWVNGAPQVHLSWSRNPPPGQGAADSNGLQKGDCFPTNPANYWCFLPNGGSEYTFTDTGAAANTQYQYRVKYRPDLTSLNTYNIFTSPANCGAPPPSPAPLDISPDFQTLPPNVTAVFTATGGDGSYVWSAPGGAISGSGGSIGVVFTNNETTSVTRTVTVTSGGQTRDATVEVEGIRTYLDDITVSGLGDRYVFINGNEPITSSSFTTLTLAHGFVGADASTITMQIANTPEAVDVVAPQPFQERIPWDLCEGRATCGDDLYTVYARYQNTAQEVAGSDVIVLDNIVYATDIEGLPTVTIDADAPVTSDRLVALALVSGFEGIPADEVSMRLSNTLDGLVTAPESFFSPVVPEWDLCDGAGSSCENGLRTVFARFCARGTCSMTVFDDIFLDSPWPSWGVRIDDDAPSAASSFVTLTLNPWFKGAGTQVLLSRDADFSQLVTASYADTLPWDLCGGVTDCGPGTYAVYVRYVDGTGNAGWPELQSPRYKDDILLGVTPTPTPLAAGILINNGAPTVTSRTVRLTLASPFGGGQNVAMRPVNEGGLSARDRGVIESLGGGIDSQPGTSGRVIRDNLPPETTPLPAPGRPTPTPAPGTSPNRISQADDTGIEIPELESGDVRKFTPEITSWDLCAERKECPYGTYKVFVQYYRTPSVGVGDSSLGALGDEVSSVYYDTVIYESPTPTPSVPPTLPPPTGSVPPPVGTPPPGGGGSGGGVSGVVGILSGAGDTIGLVAAVSSVAVIVSALITLAPLLGGGASGAAAFAWQSFRVVTGLLPRRKNVWGTVYDANTKRPIAFAKVQLLDRNKRVLETRIADKEGRYGFLTTPESLMAQNVQIQILPVAPGYRFPSATPPSVDMLIYNNLYHGDLITVSDKTLINYDVPMDPLVASAAPLVLKSPSIALGASVAAIADAGFWLGVVMVPLNFLLNPNPFTLGVMFLFFGTSSLRIWGISEHPFGTVKDSKTGRPLAFALMTLNDLSGKRVAFAVTDEQGRYFLVVERGTYELTAYTPATVQPQRQSKSVIQARKGWITRELTL